MPSSIVLAAIFGDMILAAAALGATGLAVASFAINMIASAIISKAFAPDSPSMNDRTQNPGNPQQMPPATSNKIPVVYGAGYVGGIITDLSITADNQVMYYVITLAEVTNTNPGDTPDTYTFGNIYWEGKRVILDGNAVTGLLDESTGVTDTTVAGKMNVYLYRNGSSSGVNTASTAIQIMQDAELVYQWDANKLMSNVAFAIVRLVYNQNAGTTGLRQTRFQLTNSRYAPGACLMDYWTSTRYGAALEDAQIDTATLTALDVYCAEQFTYQPYTGGSTTQTRFRFDGVLQTDNTIMNNMQAMASCCDCLIKYNEIMGLWGVIVQKPTYTVAMAIDDSNMVSSISISPIDLASSYNIAEVKFPDGTMQDSFSTASFDLAVINPSLMFPNEPVNQQTISLPLVNNNVRAQYLANRFLESAREDLQVKVDVNFTGIQLEAGDIVTVTNANYGWAAKLFRVGQVTETFTDDGQVTASLSLMEYNPSVYDDSSIVQFTPAPNTGIGSPAGFGVLYVPSVTAQQPSAAVPSFGLAVTAASKGIVQYAEVWYSAYSSPTLAQRFFAGTTAVNSGGNPYDPSSSMGVVTIGDMAQGDWYFAVRCVNALSTSDFSASSAVLVWRPMTFQYAGRYLALAYADNASGTAGFSYVPRNKSHFGIYNNDTANGGTNPALYKWYAASANFGSMNYLLNSNRANRKTSVAVGGAGFVNLGGAFVPTDTAVYDSSLWGAVQDPTGGMQSFVDLDARTGQSVVAGTTGSNVNDGFLAVTNNTNGSMVVNLHNFLNFGAGVYTKNFSAASLTIDVYGRVVGFTEQDEFYYTETVFNASAAQSTFTFAHVVGWALVFRNGALLDPTEYSETSANVTMNTACAAGEKVTLIAMRGVSTSPYYEPLNITVASSTSTTITYASAPWNKIIVGDQLAFAVAGPLFTVTAVNPATKVVTFTGVITGATGSVYRYRAALSNYPPFTRYDQDLSAVTSFAPSQYAIHNGFEGLYLNGAQISEIDYNVTDGALDGFPAAMTGRLSVIMFTPNNLEVPASNVASTVAYSTATQLTYPFPSNPLAMEVYANGALLAKGAGYDYEASANNYNLTVAFNNSITLLNQQTFARMGAA